MKKILKVLLVFILVFSFTACGSKKSNSDKVKVYIFYAGGCPYCEAQTEYLKGLEDYDKTFEIVEKELYVDHVNWEPGKDYDLGAKVATAFQEAGFTDASYYGTPFVVISDIYAKAAYSTDLEDVIKQAYDEGDNDVVACYEKGNKCEIREKLSETDKKIKDLEKKYDLEFFIAYSLLALTIIYIVYSNVKGNKSNNAPAVKNTKVEPEKKVIEKKIEKNNKPEKKASKKKKK